MANKKKEVSNGSEDKANKMNELIDPNTKLVIEKMISDFMGSPRKTELSFPVVFTSAHRKYVHQYVRKFGLKSKSHGKSKLLNGISLLINLFVTFTRSFQMEIVC